MKVSRYFIESKASDINQINWLGDQSYTCENCKKAGKHMGEIEVHNNNEQNELDYIAR